MKKSIFIFVVIVLYVQISGFGQKSTVGFTGGVSSSNMRGTINGIDQKADNKAGYTFGMIVNVPLTDRMDFQPGLHYIQKGKSVTQTNGGVKQDYITALRYAELQFNLLFTAKGSSETFFAGLGPTASINFPSKFVTKTNGSKTENDVNFGNLSASNFRAFDAGANFLAGVRFSGGFLVSLNYTLGLRNLYPGGSATNEVRNSSFGFRIGWLLKN